MCDSVLYICEKISLEDANNFDNDQMVMYDTCLIILVGGLSANGFLLRIVLFFFRQMNDLFSKVS